MPAMAAGPIAALASHAHAARPAQAARSATVHCADLHRRAGGRRAEPQDSLACHRRPAAASGTAAAMRDQSIPMSLARSFAFSAVSNFTNAFLP